MRDACSYFFRVFHLDIRSLALLRIGLGIVILHNLYILWPFINDFFVSGGVIPLKHHFSSSMYYFNWSLHAVSDNYYFIALLFITHGCAALMLILGYRTCLAVIFCWILSVSLEHRMHIIAFGEDRVLSTFLMWGIFLPLGATFSIDNILNNKDKLQPTQIVSAGTIGFICQLFLIYYVSGSSKIHESWLKDLSAVQYMFGAVDYAQPLGTWLAQFPSACKALTVLTLFLERHAIWLIFFPWGTSMMRLGLITLFIVFHLGINFSLNLGWFSWIMIVGWLALLPSGVWSLGKGKRIQKITVNLKKSPGDIAVISLLIAIIGWNIYSLDNFLHQKTSKTQTIIKCLQPLGLEQQWKFFDEPILTTREYLFSPIFENPDQIQLGSMGYYEFKQQYQFKLSHDKRWQRFVRVLKENPVFAIYLSDYLAKYWNQQFPDGPRVKAAKIILWEEDIVIDQK